MLKYVRERSSRPEVFCKKVVLRNFAKSTGKCLCQIHFFNKVAGLRTEFCEIYNYTFFYKTPTVAAAFVGIKSDHLKSHTNTVNNTSLKAVYVSQNTKYK